MVRKLFYASEKWKWIGTLKNSIQIRYPGAEQFQFFFMGLNSLFAFFSVAESSSLFFGLFSSFGSSSSNTLWIWRKMVRFLKCSMCPYDEKEYNIPDFTEHYAQCHIGKQNYCLKILFWGDFYLYSCPYCQTRFASSFLAAHHMLTCWDSSTGVSLLEITVLVYTGPTPKTFFFGKRVVVSRGNWGRWRRLRWFPGLNSPYSSVKRNFVLLSFLLIFQVFSRFSQFLLD